MAARTVSELANWDRRLDKQRQNSKWRRSSSSLARDPYHPPLENQSLDNLQPPSKLSDKRRAEKSVFRSNLERDSFANSTPNARLHRRRADTTSTFSHDLHHRRRTSVTHSAPNPALLPSPFIASSKSSNLTLNSSVHASRVHNSRPPSSRERIALSRPASKDESDVIDLTLEDTEDELFVTDMLVPKSTNHNDQYDDPGPSRRTLSSTSSSPIAAEQSLFTPPPPSKRRTQLLVAVPPFPKGLTKEDYQPLSHLPVVPSPGHTVTDTLKHSSLTEPSVTKDRTPPQKRKGKEREHDVLSSRERYKQPANGTNVVSGAFLDAFPEHITIPLHDDDTCPPLTTLDLATNTRFYFSRAWRQHASRLREAELDWISRYKLHGKASIWAQSGNVSSSRVPGTADLGSSARMRLWEFVLPESSSQEESTENSLDEQAHATGSDSAAGADVDYLLLPDPPLPGPSATSDSTLSNSTASQGLAVDTEHDMNQYFNGLGDSSPTTHVVPRQQHATHTFRPHLLQSAGSSQTSPLGLEFPSLALDPRLADTGDHECFFGVPPSPPPADAHSSTAPGPITESPFEPVNYFPASPNNIFETSPAGAWPFGQGEGLLPDNNPPSNDHVAPSISGTIDPSLLGPEQSETQSRTHKVTTPRRRSKLPEPVIYIRRPIDSSSLPLLSGKRPVQIKYRDSGGTPTTPSTQTGINEDGNCVEQTGNDTDVPVRTKRRSKPSRKLRESYAAFDSDSDYAPETSTSKIKLMIKRPSTRDKESIAEHQGKETVPGMSCCHQCRNTSTRPKMSCSNLVHGRVCGKRFCNRCILYRYPDITFDEYSAGFLCPACTNTCNCSLCSRSRGEEFISMRLGGLATSLFKAKVTLVRDVGQPLHRPESLPPTADARRSRGASAATTRTTPTPEPSALSLPSQSQFWAHVYGMEGERVGSAFMTREHMERLRAGGPSAPPAPSVSQPQPPPRKKARKPSKRDRKPRGPRVFIGRPLASWKVRAVRDLEPSVEVETRTTWDEGEGEDRGTGQGRGWSSSTASDRLHRHGRRRRRCYVGNSAPLYEPYGRMPPPSLRCLTKPGAARDSDGSPAPLSEPEGAADDGDDVNWPQPGVGECCTWEPPAPPGVSVSVSSGGLSGPFVGEPPGLESLPGSVGTWPDVDGLQGLRPGLGVGLGAAMDVNSGQGRGRASAPTGPFSNEDMQKAIHAALTALSLLDGGGSS